MVTGTRFGESVRSVNGNGRAAFLVLSVVFVSLLVFGCQAPGTTQKRQWNAVRIDSFASIAGNWAGLMVSAPKARRDDWVRASISHDGRYKFASYSTIGVFSGRGQFALVDGKLTVMTERGSATGSLFVSDEARMLRFVGMMKDGTEYTAELDPAK